MRLLSCYSLQSVIFFPRATRTIPAQTPQNLSVKLAAERDGAAIRTDHRARELFGRH
jgi:hypothetical protein